MKIGLIGCGKMGSALLKGIYHSIGSEVETLKLYDAYPASAVELASEVGAEISPDIQALVSESDIVLLCVKPNNTSEALEASSNWNDTLLISIAAGVTIDSLERHTQNQARVVRVMPNTPSLIGEGASAYCLGTNATSEDSETAELLLKAVGTVSSVSEPLIDTVTGLSGSGPAYVFTIIEALADAGVKNGLPRQEALNLASQTVKGAAMLVQETNLHPAVLRDQVTSPGGTTIAGLSALEEKGLRSALISAVDAATQRSKELG